VLVAVTTHPRWTLLILAYGYLLSAFVGLAVTRFRRRGGGAAPPPPAAEPAPATGPPEE